MLLVVPKGSTLEKGEKEGLIALVVIRPVFILSMHPSDQHLALHCALLRVYVLLGHEEQHLLRQHHAACGAAWPAAQPTDGKNKNKLFCCAPPRAAAVLSTGYLPTPAEGRPAQYFSLQARCSAGFLASVLCSSSAHRWVHQTLFSARARARRARSPHRIEGDLGLLRAEGER